MRLVKATLIRQVRENDNATKRYKVQCWKHDIVRLVKAMLIGRMIMRQRRRNELI